MLTINELTEHLTIAKSTLYNLAQEGRIPAQRVGKHRRFHKAALDRWLERPGEFDVDNGGEEDA